VFPAALYGEQTRQCAAWQGVAQCGGAGRGSSCRRQHGGFRLSLLLFLEGRCGRERHGQVRPGLARRGAVMVADGSTGGFGFLCCSLRRVVVAVWGTLRHG
jgi:hypothetical protein